MKQLLGSGFSQFYSEDEAWHSMNGWRYTDRWYLNRGYRNSTQYTLFGD